MNDILLLIANNVLEIVFAAIGAVFSAIVIPWIVKTVIPWLKEKHIYSLVQKFVAAAEKRAEAGTLAKPLKKDYVIGLLEARGITVTEEIDAFIEAAVKELDNAIQSAVLEVAGVMEQTVEGEEAEAE